MKIGRYTKLADGLRTTPVPLVQLAQATPLDARIPVLFLSAIAPLKSPVPCHKSPFGATFQKCVLYR